MSDTPVVDWSGPLAQVDGNREVLCDIVQAYIEEIRDNLEQLPAVLAAGDASEARRRAHTLKGAMRMFAASPAQEIALEVEELAAAGRLDDAKGRYDAMRDAIERVVPELERFVATQGASAGP